MNETQNRIRIREPVKTLSPTETQLPVSPHRLHCPTLHLAKCEWRAITRDSLLQGWTTQSWCNLVSPLHIH
jgi:hypothetical protein